MYKPRRLGWSPKSSASYICLLLLAVLYPLLVRGDHGWLAFGVLTFIYAVAANGLRWLYGQGGLLSVAHGALVGVGAYTVMVLGQRLGLGLGELLVLAAGVSALLAALLALTTARLVGHYFAIVTFAFAEMAVGIGENWTALTGGATGIVFQQEARLGPLTINTDRSWYYFALASFVCSALILAFLARSSLGKRLAAVRENDQLAEAVGINVLNQRVFAFAISGCFAGVAGAYWAYYVGFAAPPQFGPLFGITLVLVVLLGGSTSSIGPVVGAFIVLVAPQMLNVPADITQMIIGVLFIAIILALPGGIAGSLPGVLALAVTSGRRSSSRETTSEASMQEGVTR